MRNIHILADGPFTRKLAAIVREFGGVRNFVVDSIEELKDEGPPCVCLLILVETDCTHTTIAISRPLRAETVALYGVRQSDALRKISNVLEAVGSEYLLDPVNGDGSPNCFQSWMRSFWAALDSQAHVSCFPLQYAVQPSKETPETIDTPEGFQRIMLKDNTKLTADTYTRPSHMLTLDISNTSLTYKLGDHIIIRPCNSDEAVTQAGEQLGLDLDEVVRLTLMKPGTSLFPCDRPVRVRDLFKYYLDIQGLARRKFLLGLSLVAEDEADVAMLDDLATCMEPGSPYQQKVKGLFSHMDAIRQFASVKLTLEQVLSLIPPMQPRSYSASSSPLEDPGTVQCTFVVLSYPTPDGRHFKGLSTNYLCSLRPGDSVAMTICKGFEEIEVDTPGIRYVACALGSGIALLRGIAQHFYNMRTKLNQDAGKMLLYYGVRHEDQDFIYNKELLKYQKAGVLKMYTSFSHDQQEFITPAHRIRESQREVAEFLTCDHRCKFVYCGPAGPAYSSIEMALIEAIQSSRPDLDPHKLINDMKATSCWEIQAFTPSQDPENPFL